MNRKELTRRYKETPRPMGVYCVRNTANGDVFIGWSVNLPAILNRHRFDLQTGHHRNRTLQGQWDTAGEAAFSFEVLDTIEHDDVPGYDPAEDLTALEEVWIEKIGVDEDGRPGHVARVSVIAT